MPFKGSRRKIVKKKINLLDIPVPFQFSQLLRLPRLLLQFLKHPADALTPFRTCGLCSCFLPQRSSLITAAAL